MPFGRDLPDTMPRSVRTLGTRRSTTGPDAHLAGSPAGPRDDPARRPGFSEPRNDGPTIHRPTEMDHEPSGGHADVTVFRFLEFPNLDDVGHAHQFLGCVGEHDGL